MEKATILILAGIFIMSCAETPSNKFRLLEYKSLNGVEASIASNKSDGIYTNCVLVMGHSQEKTKISINGNTVEVYNKERLKAMGFIEDDVLDGRYENIVEDKYLVTVEYLNKKIYVKVSVIDSNASVIVQVDDSSFTLPSNENMIVKSLGNPDYTSRIEQYP